MRMMFLDRVLNHLHSISSSPQRVPSLNSIKSPSQEVNGLSSSYNSPSFSSRWKRNSPDPSKMISGKSPNSESKRSFLSSTPRRNSHMSERVGSPSLSGYLPVRINYNLIFFVAVLMQRTKF